MVMRNTQLYTLLYQQHCPPPCRGGLRFLKLVVAETDEKK